MSFTSDLLDGIAQHLGLIARGGVQVDPGGSTDPATVTLTLLVKSLKIHAV